MQKKLFVGNLPHAFDDEDLKELFAKFGTVESASVIMDRDLGRSKGFGFVVMSSDNEAQEAINGMNGQEAGGRKIVVNEAHEKKERDRSGPPRGRGGFGGGREGGFGGGREGGFRGGREGGFGERREGRGGGFGSRGH